MTINDDAIIMNEEQSYVFAGKSSKEKYTSIKISDITGENSRNKTVITLLDSLPSKYQFVTKGAYFLHAQSINGELINSH